MNIFYLDSDPYVAAKMHCDKHVVKMILESAQMLSTAHRVLDGDEYADERGLYKMAHKNHPCTIWARSSTDNYVWLNRLFGALCKEYTYRYGKHHASERLLAPLAKVPNGLDFTDIHYGFTEPPQCMPDYCKGEETVKAYQTYYIVEKSDFAKWSKRKMPDWFTGETNAKGKSRSIHTTENA
tara:strand:- start:1312 stop:1857 length:546 start_codon:yes stop_codon:yes gene_type:complete